MILNTTAWKSQQSSESLRLLVPRLCDVALHRFSKIQRRIGWTETTTRDDVHPVMKEFNIFTGYRHTGRGWRYYLSSAFQLHNETLNWATHAIGGLIVLALATAWQLQLPASADSRDVILAWMFCIMSVMLHAASGAAHLLHNRSELWHCILFFVDNASVGMGAYASNLLSICCFSSESYFNWIGPVAIPVLVFGAICLSASYSLALAAYRRRYNFTTSLLMFGPSGCFLLFGLVPIVERQLAMGPAEADFLGLPHHIIFVAAVACYATNFPECCWPGKFDLIGHSHQLFHILVTATHCAVLSAAFGQIRLDGPALFSKRLVGDDWVTVQGAFWGLVVALAFNLAIVLLYAKAFRYDSSFTSRAARGKLD